MKLPHLLSKAFMPNCFSISVIASCSLFAPYPLQAQVVPDNTLPVNSQVTSNGNIFAIDGGTTAGGNLFHSFGQFSVSTGSTAFFNNALNIQNIFSRVTGGSVSNINGIIQANGTANLFFLNPKGIIFGPNASLNIGGSFLASTASSINFADGTQFSATNPQAQPLLTMSVPIGLGFGNNPGAIRVQGTGNIITFVQPTVFSPYNRGSSLTGLRVQPGNTLALVGGDVALEGGTLTAEEGRIELGSVGNGTVGLSSTPFGWTLGYGEVQSFRDIQLSQKALADASGNGGGSIQVQGQNVTLTDGSIILIQNQGSQPAGSINVSASRSLEVNGTTPDQTISSNVSNIALGAGNGGDIGISTQQLLVQGGGIISTRTFGAGRGGNLSVNASKSVQVIGPVLLNPSITSTISATTTSSGNAGNITVSTGNYLITNGGNTGSVTFGTGSGGNVIVNATQSVELIGVIPISLSPSAVSAVTGNAGNAGSVIINTSKLVLRDGGSVTASTLAAGAAGSVTINASDSVEVSGTVPGAMNPSLVSSSANIERSALLRKIFGLPDEPTGASGNVTINTSRLMVTDGARVNVSHDGSQGNAGKLTINANSIVLDNQGGITAATASGQGGNITLNVKDSLQMRHSSIISAAAGGNDQTGGNIIINAGAIAAIPKENSDITASAPQGTGGRTTINTQGIFGLQVRDRPTPESDIISVGKTPEFNGIVQVNTPDVNVQGALNQLNANLVNTEQAIANSCFARRNAEQGSFTVTGTSGLPTTPYEALSSQYPVTQVQGLSSAEGLERGDAGTREQKRELVQNLGERSSSTPTWQLDDSIVEAQGMTLTPDGRIIAGTAPQLVAVRQAKDFICNFTKQEISTR